MIIIAKLVKVECHYTWEDNEEFSTWHFASINGAYRFIAKQKDLVWYSVQEEKFIPCNEDEPDGQLYIGCDYMDIKHILITFGGVA